MLAEAKGRERRRSERPPGPRPRDLSAAPRGPGPRGCARGPGAEVVGARRGRAGRDRPVSAGDGGGRLFLLPRGAAECGQVRARHAGDHPPGTGGREPDLRGERRRDRVPVRTARPPAPGSKGSPTDWPRSAGRSRSDRRPATARPSPAASRSAVTHVDPASARVGRVGRLRRVRRGLDRPGRGPGTQRQRCARLHFVLGAIVLYATVVR